MVRDLAQFGLADQVVDVAEKVVLVQRDFGDRTDRKHSRFKYTVDDRGADWILAKLNEYLGYELGPVRPFTFEDNGDRYGWTESHDGRSHFTLFIQSGRVKDEPGYSLRSALREIALVHQGDFRLTANQNLIIANVSPGDRPRIDALLRRHRLDTANGDNDYTHWQLGAVWAFAAPFELRVTAHDTDADAQRVFGPWAGARVEAAPGETLLLPKPVGATTRVVAMDSFCRQQVRC